MATVFAANFGQIGPGFVGGDLQDNDSIVQDLDFNRLIRPRGIPCPSRNLTMVDPIDVADRLGSGPRIDRCQRLCDS